MPMRRQAPSGAGIRGRVVTADRHPLTDAAVALARNAPAHRDIAALTDAAGAFAFRGLECGIYDVCVSADGFPQRRKTAIVGTGAQVQLDFVLQR